MASLGGLLPISAAMLSGAVKTARPGRKAALGPREKSRTGVKSAPARKGLLPSRPAMGGLAGLAGLPGLS
jgi:hypothetical protein